VTADLFAPPFFTNKGFFHASKPLAYNTDNDKNYTAVLPPESTKYYHAIRRVQPRRSRSTLGRVTARNIHGFATRFQQYLLFVTWNECYSWRENRSDEGGDAEKLEVIIGSSERLQLNRGVSGDACTLLNK
jgi:hypothetical protein